MPMLMIMLTMGAGGIVGLVYIYEAKPVRVNSSSWRSTRKKAKTKKTSSLSDLPAVNDEQGKTFATLPKWNEVRIVLHEEI